MTGHALTDWVWIQSATLEERVVRVRHAEGTTIEVITLGGVIGSISLDKAAKQHSMTLFEHVSLEIVACSLDEI